MGYFEKLRESARGRESLLCVGLDPEPDRIEDGVAGAIRHCRDVIARTSDYAAAYKPNAAFWEQYGPDGWDGLVEVKAAISPDIPVILDAKRADVPHTSAAYARAAFDVLGFDAMTVHAYHGGDSLAEFVARPDRAVYVVCRTSNAGARDLQHLEAGGEPLYLRVAELAESVAERGNVGLVAGSTAPAEIAELRRHTQLPLLLPGVGAQGGELEASIAAAWTGDPAGCLVNASRSILYADDPSAAARDLRDRMRALVTAGR
jgi:orotidine 5'-phosphate decarboxylase subfamily 2